MLWKTPAKEKERNPSLIAFPKTKQRKNTLFCQWFKNSLQLFPGEGPCRGPWGTQHHPVGTQPGSAPWKEPCSRVLGPLPALEYSCCDGCCTVWALCLATPPAAASSTLARKHTAALAGAPPSLCYQGSNAEPNATHRLEEQEQQCFNCCNLLQMQ